MRLLLLCLHVYFTLVSPLSGVQRLSASCPCGPPGHPPHATRWDGDGPWSGRSLQPQCCTIATLCSALTSSAHCAAAALLPCALTLRALSCLSSGGLGQAVFSSGVVGKAAPPGPNQALGASREGSRAGSLLSSAFPGEKGHGAVLPWPTQRMHQEWRWAGAHMLALPLHWCPLHLPVTRGILLRALQHSAYWAMELLHCLAVIFYSL